MKTAIIVHRWDGNSKSDWCPWLKNELENKGYNVKVPEMPNTDKPKINAWISHLKKIIGKPNKDTILIGHSIGCQTIMRYLEKENFNDKVNVIFVAGWFKLDNLENKEVEEIARPWLKTTINFDKVKEKIGNLIVFLSSNEPYNYIKENKETFERNLGAKVFILKNKGHFTEDDNIKKLPEVLEFIK